MVKINWFFGYGLGGGVAIVDSGSGGSGSGDSGSGDPVEFPQLSFLSHYWKLEEGVGARQDSKGSLTLSDPNGNTINATGIQGSSALIDPALSNYLISGSTFPTPTVFSISAWINVQGSNGLFRTIISKQNSSNNQQSFNLAVNDSEKIAYLSSSNGSASGRVIIESSETITLGNTYHVVATFDGSLVKVYLNGGLSNSGSQSAVFDSSEKLMLGANNNTGSPGSFFDGWIDEVAFYDGVALSASEVSSLYNSGSGIFYDSSGSSNFSYTPYANFSDATVEFIDLSQTNVNLKGFTGGFVDNGYAYLVPYNNGSSHGYFTRVNLTDFSTVEFIDLSQTNVNLKGFDGGFVDNGYAYLAPHFKDGSYDHGYFTRVNLTDFSTVEFIDLSQTNVNLKGFTEGFASNGYGYLFPYNNGSLHGYFTRVNLTDFSTVEFIDLSQTNVNLKGFYSGFTDNNYGYLVPYSNSFFTRVNLTDFSTVEFIDLTQINANLINFYGGFIDNNYGYLVPYSNGFFTRVNLTDFSTVEFIDLTQINANLKGFIGGFSDNGYAYLVPYNNGSPSGYFVRVNLTDFSTVEFINLTQINANLKGFIRGFVDNGYAYLAPRFNGVPHGYFTKIKLGNV